MLRVAILAPHNKYSDPFRIFPVDHGIGEVVECVDSPSFVCRGAEARKLDQ